MADYRSRFRDWKGNRIVQAVSQDEIPEILVLGKGMVEIETAALENRIRTVQACRNLAEQADFDEE